MTDSDGNTVTSDKVDLSSIDTNTVLENASDGLKLENDNLTLSVKDTDGNEVKGSVSVEELKGAIRWTSIRIPS